MPTLAAPLDCAQLETRNERVHQLGAAPSTPVTGQMYYNTANNTLFWWNGTAWIAAQGGTPTGTAGGDLSGTYPNPQIASATILLTDMAASCTDQSAATASLRTLGTGLTQACAGSDVRLSDQRQPGGGATGDLTGTYPGPTIAALAVTDAKVAAANKDGLTTVASMRTLGTGAQQACSGTDSRLTDSRAPTGTAGGDLTGSTYPNPVIAALAVTDGKVAAANKDGLVNVASMRTLGFGAQQALAGTSRLDQIAVPTAAVNLNNQKITGLATPTATTDAATKAYVDAAAQGLDVKPSCRIAASANRVISGPGANIDGIALVAGDRCLLIAQTAPAENGIWIWNGAAVAMTRSTDADTSAEVTTGMFTFIEEGSQWASAGFVLTTVMPIVLGTTALTFTQFSGGGAITAGTGLTQAGSVINAIGTAGRISVGTDNIDIDGAYAGQASITTVGTIGSGTWGAAATPIGITSGGTSGNSASTARANLAAAGYFSSATHAAGTSWSYNQVTHGLRATRGLIVQCQVEATGAIVLPDITVDTAGLVTITFSASQTLNTIRTTIMG